MVGFQLSAAYRAAALELADSKSSDCPFYQVCPTRVAHPLEPMVRKAVKMEQMLFARAGPAAYPRSLPLMLDVRLKSPEYAWARETNWHLVRLLRHNDYKIESLPSAKNTHIDYRV